MPCTPIDPFRLVKDASEDARAEGVQAVANVLDIVRLDFTNVSHEISDIALGIRNLLVDVVFSENLVDLAQHTRHVAMDVDDTSVVGLIERQRAHGDLRHVDTASGDTLVDVPDEGIGNLDTDGALSLLSAATDMGGKDDVVEAAKVLAPLVELVGEIVAIGGRLVGEDVQSGTSNLAAAHGLNQSRNIDNSTTAGVDEVGAGLHLLELSVGDQVLGLGSLRNVKGDKVGLPKESLKSRHLASSANSHEVDNVIVDDGHAHGLRQNGQLRANVAVADNTEGLAADLPALGAHLVPGAAVHLAGAVAELAGEGDDLSNHQLSNRAGVGERRVENGNTMLSSIVKINLVGTNAEAADNEQVLSFPENIGSKLGLGADANDMNIPLERMLVSCAFGFSRNYE